MSGERSPTPAKSGRKRRRALRWLFASAALVVVAMAIGCSMLSEFKPEIDTPAMRSEGIDSHFLDTSFGRMHYVTAGHPPPAPRRVFFVHGSPGTWDAWKIWLEDPRLRDRARLVAADRLGFGGSERGKAEPSLARQVGALAAILDGEPGPPAIVVGHSLGGPIATRLAMDRPDLVAGLVLVAPSIDPGLEKRRWYNVAASLLVVQWFLPVDWTTSNRELWPLKGELTQMTPKWEAIAVPVVVVQGDQDDLVPPANADFAEKMAPSRVEVHRVPGENHFVLWSKPETVTGPILDLLERASTVAPPVAADPVG